MQISGKLQKKKFEYLQRVIFYDKKNYIKKIIKLFPDIKSDPTKIVCNVIIQVVKTFFFSEATFFSLFQILYFCTWRTLESGPSIIRKWYSQIEVLKCTLQPINTTSRSKQCKLNETAYMRFISLA